MISAPASISARDRYTHETSSILQLEADPQSYVGDDETASFIWTRIRIDAGFGRVALLYGRPGSCTNLEVQPRFLAKSPAERQRQRLHARGVVVAAGVVIVTLIAMVRPIDRGDEALAVAREVPQTKSREAVSSSIVIPPRRIEEVDSEHRSTESSRNRYVLEAKLQAHTSVVE
jgi:hypothetical protein